MNIDRQRGKVTHEGIIRMIVSSCRTQKSGENFRSLRDKSSQIFEKISLLSRARNNFQRLIKQLIHGDSRSCAIFSIESRFMWLDQLSTKFDFSLGFKDAREICVFPVYLLRGHVACNRFSFHDPLATTTRIERRFRRISRFEWSFFFFVPPPFFLCTDNFSFRSFARPGIIFFDEKWTRTTGYGSALHPFRL